MTNVCLFLVPFRVSKQRSRNCAFENENEFVGQDKPGPKLSSRDNERTISTRARQPFLFRSIPFPSVFLLLFSHFSSFYSLTFLIFSLSSPFYLFIFPPVPGPYLSIPPPLNTFIYLRGRRDRLAPVKDCAFIVDLQLRSQKVLQLTLHTFLSLFFFLGGERSMQRTLKSVRTDDGSLRFIFRINHPFPFLFVFFLFSCLFYFSLFFSFFFYLPPIPILFPFPLPFSFPFLSFFLFYPFFTFFYLLFSYEGNNERTLPAFPRLFFHASLQPSPLFPFSLCGKKLVSLSFSPSPTSRPLAGPPNPPAHFIILLLHGCSSSFVSPSPFFSRFFFFGSYAYISPLFSPPLHTHHPLPLSHHQPPTLLSSSYLPRRTHALY